MSDTFYIKHPIDVRIMAVLSRREFARFVDLKDKKTDTNLLTYHLKKLQTHSYIQKTKTGYTLAQNGIAYIENLTKNVHTPHVRVMILIQNSEGDVLLVKRPMQPYINTWTLPFRDLDVGDRSLAIAAARIGVGAPPLRHVGDAYIRTVSGSDIVSSTLVHVMRGESDSFTIDGEHQWVQPYRLVNERLTPGIEQFITRSFFGDTFFFEEYEEPAILT